MHKQLFHYKVRNVIADRFNHCTLKVPIGKFSPGDVIDVIALDYENAEILMFVAEKAYSYKLFFDLSRFN